MGPGKRGKWWEKNGERERYVDNCFFFYLSLSLPSILSAFFPPSLPQQPTLYLFSVQMKDIVPMVNFLPRKNYYQLSGRSDATPENREMEEVPPLTEREMDRQRDREIER